jgi:pilus assembly protein Flp/PilA
MLTAILYGLAMLWQQHPPVSPRGGSYRFTTILKLLRNEDGATAIEYGLIAALIAVAAVTVMGTVGTNLTNTFTTVAGKL